jgi:hypothetical protein
MKLLWMKPIWMMPVKQLELITSFWLGFMGRKEFAVLFPEVSVPAIAIEQGARP